MSKHSSQRNDGLPPLGVGITYSPAIETLVTGHPDEFDVVEIEPQTIWVERQDEPSRYRIPGQMLRHLARLPGRKTIHSLGVPVGGAVPPEVHQLELLQDTIEQLGAPWITEHLSFNSTGEFSTGFFLPPRQTMDGVATAARNIRALQSTFSVPVGVEQALIISSRATTKCVTVNL
ncbi:MAG: multinuclear nonheme iron-dependent oxidase [Blastocatellia bacterium]